MRGLVAPLAALLLLGTPASAEVLLQGVSWRRVTAERTPKLRPSQAGADSKSEEISSFDMNGPKSGARLRLRLRLANRGPHPAEGILLKYSLSAKVAPPDVPAEEAWAVPFLLDERRIPKLGPNQAKEIVLDPSLVLGDYLRRLARSGYEAKALRVRVMVEPRAGEMRKLEILESDLSLGGA